MAANKSVKEPHSLNDSHHFFPEDLSATPETSSTPLDHQHDTPTQPQNLINDDVDDPDERLLSQNYWYALSKFSDDPISNEVQQFSDDRSLSQNPGGNLKPVKEVEDPLRFFLLEGAMVETNFQCSVKVYVNKDPLKNHQQVKVTEDLLSEEVPQGLDDNSPRNSSSSSSDNPQGLDNNSARNSSSSTSDDPSSSSSDNTGSVSSNMNGLMDMGCGCKGDTAVAHYCCILKWRLRHPKTECEICGCERKNIREVDCEYVSLDGVFQRSPDAAKWFGVPIEGRIARLI
ncbi:hypothetical protein TSUD_78360 [Trifolium subterraneum]|uniref:RING-CH-type domain-containing protein n=1 Tax=Trifolium subterraneum TaxID=3900 RepID=A0A2Z6LT92_TRISU|nr:hypothetical protein TSUD_78360 [Trifolium subterraneum]